MKFIGVHDDKEEWLKSEFPALEQLFARGYEYKSQSELNREKRLSWSLLYDRLEAAIRKDNPQIDQDGVYDYISIMDSHCKVTIKAKTTIKYIAIVFAAAILIQSGIFILMLFRQFIYGIILQEELRLKTILPK